MNRNYTIYDGEEIIDSGQYEITWEQVSKECKSLQPIVEHTTVTKNIRRIARFDPEIVIKAINAILDKYKSRKKPIIILQSDHGPSFPSSGNEEYKIRMRILNAYYLPDVTRSLKNWAEGGWGKSIKSLIKRQRKKLHSSSSNLRSHLTKTPSSASGMN